MQCALKSDDKNSKISKLPLLRHIGMAAVRMKCRCGFKPATEVRVCHTGPYHPTSSTGYISTHWEL